MTEQDKIHPDPSQCDCGGSGYLPGIPEDEPCPEHGQDRRVRDLIHATDALKEAYLDSNEADLGIVNRAVRAIAALKAPPACERCDAPAATPICHPDSGYAALCAACRSMLGLPKAQAPTPGSWVVDECPDARGDWTVRRDDGTDNGDTEAQPIATFYRLADAEQGAAAPDLLAALEECLWLMVDREILEEHDGDTFNRAQAAIRKARGL